MTKKPKKPTYPGAPNKLKGDTAWFYTTAKGVLVITEVRLGNGVYLGTGQATISWKKIEAALAIHRKVRRAR